MNSCKLTLNFKGDVEMQTKGSKPPVTAQSENLLKSDKIQVASKRKFSFESSGDSADKRPRQTTQALVGKETGKKGGR